MLVNEPDYVFRERYPEREEVYARFDAASAALRRDRAGMIGLPYGQHPRCRFDLFPGATAGALVVFIHGGYWSSLSKARYSFVAAPFLQQGTNVALLGYPLAPEVSIGEIERHVLKGLDAVFQRLAEQGRKPYAWVLTGHSAGGHLAACAAQAWNARRPALSGLVPISGLFDLTPLIATSLNAKLKLDRARARAYSPLFRPPAVAPLTLVVGGAETPGFLKQSRLFLEHCRHSGHCDPQLVERPGANHYSILMDFLKPQSAIAGIVSGLCDPR
ncbi:MAG: alpha/beta hydrolase [Rhodospirillales bacterium]